MLFSKKRRNARKGDVPGEDRTVDAADFQRDERRKQNLKKGLFTFKLLFAGAFALFLFFNAFYTIGDSEYAVVTTFGPTITTECPRYASTIRANRDRTMPSSGRITDDSFKRWVFQ